MGCAKNGLLFVWAGVLSDKNGLLFAAGTLGCAVTGVSQLMSSKSFFVEVCDCERGASLPASVRDGMSSPRIFERGSGCGVSSYSPRFDVRPLLPELRRVLVVAREC